MKLQASVGYFGPGPGSAGRAAPGCQPPLGGVAYSCCLLPPVPPGSSRSFMLEGSPVAVCVRCLGIYCGAALAGMSVPGKGSPRLLAIGIAAQFARRRHRHASLAWQSAPGSILVGAAAGNRGRRGTVFALEAIRVCSEGLNESSVRTADVNCLVPSRRPGAPYLARFSRDVGYRM